MWNSGVIEQWLLHNRNTIDDKGTLTEYEREVGFFWHSLSKQLLHFFALFYFCLMLLLHFTDTTNDLSLRDNVARKECRNVKNAKIHPKVSELTL